MKVKDLMTDKVVKVSTDDTVLKAALLMRHWDIGAVPVELDGHFAGIITDRDITLRCVAEDIKSDQVKAGDIMTSEHLVSISPEHSVIEAARIMAREQIRRLPVCENGRIVGMLSLGDLAAAKKMFSETAAAFCDISEKKKKKY